MEKLITPDCENERYMFSENINKKCLENRENINKIIEVLNKITSNTVKHLTVTIPEGEYNIWGNNPKEKGFSILENLTINETGLNRGYFDLSIKIYIAENYISKKELKDFLDEEYGKTFKGSINQVILDKIIDKFNL